MMGTAAAAAAAAAVETGSVDTVSESRSALFGQAQNKTHCVCLLPSRVSLLGLKRPIPSGMDTPSCLRIGAQPENHMAFFAFGCLEWGTLPLIILCSIEGTRRVPCMPCHVMSCMNSRGSAGAPLTHCVGLYTGHNKKVL